MNKLTDTCWKVNCVVGGAGVAVVDGGSGIGEAVSDGELNDDVLVVMYLFNSRSCVEAALRLCGLCDWTSEEQLLVADGIGAH